MTSCQIRLAGLLLGLLPLSQTALAGPPTIRADKAHTTLSYSCAHTLHEWTGVDRNVEAVAVLNEAGDQITKVAVAGKVSDFDSGNSNRDSHALEVLDAIKYPKVTFVSTSITPEGPNLKVVGNLTFHGVTKPVAFIATRQTNDKAMAFSGEFQVKLSDFNIDPPTFMLVPMDDAMKLDFAVVFPR